MRDQKVFYGWWVVGAFSVTTFMSTGVRHAVGCELARHFPLANARVFTLGPDPAAMEITGVAPQRLPESDLRRRRQERRADV